MCSLTKDEWVCYAHGRDIIIIHNMLVITDVVFGQAGPTDALKDGFLNQQGNG